MLVSKRAGSKQSSWVLFVLHLSFLMLGSIFYSELKQMGLQADDVFRLVEMTLFLAILMPISVRLFASRWHAATKLHRLINLVYFVDIVRRHSHPHSWILNTPVFVIYLLDAYVFRRWFNRNKSPEVKRGK